MDKYLYFFEAGNELIPPANIMALSDLIGFLTMILLTMMHDDTSDGELYHCSLRRLDILIIVLVSLVIVQVVLTTQFFSSGNFLRKLGSEEIPHAL